MITVFVDESGNLGNDGRYFVIALIVPQRGKRISNFMKAFCAKNNLTEIKASQLSFPQKQDIFNKLTSANDYTVSYIVADKKHITNEQLFRDKNLLYNYLFSFLIRKTIKGSNEDVRIMLDNHSTKTIQAADVIANAIYAKYTYGKDHFYNILTISESIKFPQSTFGQEPPVNN